MFHIDFGFIFGQDPKPMPPPFRFIRAMADAMGGEDGENYGRFKTFCCQVRVASVDCWVGDAWLAIPPSASVRVRRLL
jgi:hypothetical protein